MITSTQIAEAIGDFPPTEEQAAVIEAPLIPGLVVAGAGSGKTTTMAARVVFLVVNGVVSPDEVLGLTFTRKAARELSERIRGALAQARRVLDMTELSGMPSVSTYDAFAGALVRDHALRIGEDPDASLVTRSAAWQVMAEVVESWPHDISLDLTPSSVINRALELANELRSNLLTVAEARNGMRELADMADKDRGGKLLKKNHVHGIGGMLRARAELLDLVEAFQERKRERGVVEYSDQVAIACQLAAAIPTIGEGMRARHRAVLLDEFQDTSIAQLGLMSDLFGAGHAVTAVGDPNQAIYSWRGASADSLDGFREAFRSEGTEVPVFSLATSWRNDTAILDAANAVSRPLRELSRVHVEPLAARPGAAAGEISARVTVTEKSEAGAIAEWIGARWHGVAGGRTAAVLVRARRQFTQIVHALREAGIPTEVVGLSGLLRAPEVVDLRSALIVAHDASRGDAMMRLLTNQRIGVTDLMALQRWARELAGDDEDSSSIVEAVENLPPDQWRGGALSVIARERITRLAAQLRRIRALLSYPIADVISGAERILGLDIEVAARAHRDATSARANLDAFAKHADSFAAGSLNPSLGGFLDWLDSADSNERGLELGATEPSAEAVQVLTVHAAKGLEWDIVCVAGMSESEFPGYSARSGPRTNKAGEHMPGSSKGWLSPAGGLPYPLRGDADSLPEVDLDRDDHADQDEEIAEFYRRDFAHGIAEERRLAYVALTRAKSELLLSSSWAPKGTIREISRFLEEARPFAEASGGVAIDPRPDEVPVDVEVFAPYPTMDPAGERRARLDAAARAVWSAEGVTIAEVLAGDSTIRARADLARALLHDDGDAGPVAHLPRRLSASAALHLVADPTAFALALRRPTPSAPPAAARLGTTFHEWVENYFNIPAAIFDDDPGELLEDDGTESFAELREAFLASQWSQRRPSEIELDLETEVAGYRVSCRVDAVYTDGARTEIVDWKTGRVPRGEDRIAERTFQLELYRLAYARSRGVPVSDVGARLVYVAGGEEITAQGLTEAQIVARIARAVNA